MIFGALVWVLGKRRADIVDTVARAVWAGMGACLLVLLWALFSGQG